MFATGVDWIPERNITKYLLWSEKMTNKGFAVDITYDPKHFIPEILGKIGRNWQFLKLPVQTKNELFAHYISIETNVFAIFNAKGTKCN
jgi:hypothetical protein